MSRLRILKSFFLTVLILCLLIIPSMSATQVAAADNSVKGIGNIKVVNDNDKDKNKNKKASPVNAKTQPAEPAPSKKPVVKPPAKPPPVKQAKAPVKPETVKEGLITAIRWANHVDAVTGAEKVRVVLDTSSPVKVQDTFVNVVSGNQVVVTITGAQPDSAVPKKLTFDGKTINKAVISAVETNNTKIVFDLPMPINQEEYSVFTLNKNTAENKPFRVVVDINKPLPPPDFSFTAGLKDKVIVVDPGHGGSDPGAIGANGTQEKKITLAVSMLVKTLLEKEGSKVIMTRNDDRDVYGPNSTAGEELGARVNIANYRKADIFVSIHNDSFTNRTVGGTSTFYYQKTIYDVMLANSLQKSILKAGGLQDRRANASNLYVVKRTRMPAALVELAFLSNPAEERLLNSADFQLKMANGIVSGIKEFFEQAAKLRGDK